ncbi:hypothetical protein K1719_002721 [Acacia pycnantha]|nr:hypothetical protein K1719_002721 [Acacia pycnantha]
MEVKDPSIKLFGTMISMPLQCSVSTTHSFEPVRPFSLSSSPDTSARDQYSSKIELITPKQEDGASPQIQEDLKSLTSLGVCENPKTKALSPSVERENFVLKSSKFGEQSETSTQQEKTPKKPDKILSCRRCNSMETKFCYFNNYNVNQSRHFYKNYQRYWIARGTTRNVPVGDVLTFGSSNYAICDSMASVLNLAKNIQNGVLNGVHVSKQNITISCSREYNGDDHLLWS